MIQNMSSAQSNTNFGKKFVVPNSIASNVLEPIYKEALSGMGPERFKKCEHISLITGRTVIATGRDVAKLNEQHFDSLRGKALAAEIEEGAELITSVPKAIAKILGAIIKGE